jgi:erythritol kinase
MKHVLVGIDAGTSVIKSVAFDLRGRQIAAASVPNRYETLPGGGAEQDPVRTWQDTVATLRSLAEIVPGLGGRLAAIAVTGQGDGSWLIDRDGAPVGKGWLWLDARAAGIVEEMRARPEDRLRYQKTGTGLAACQQGPQLVWMQRHAPEQLARAATAFHCKDWLYFRLTGERVTDPSEGTFTFGDFRSRAYSDEVIGALGLEQQRRLLPETVEGTERHAALSSEAAAATGLAAGTPVVLGYVDVICTALGAGLYDHDDRPGCTIIGSTGMHMRLARTADEIQLNGEATGYTMAMPIPGVLAQMQSNMAATLNIDWVLGLATGILAAEGIVRRPDEMIALVDKWTDAARPTALLYQPYVSEAGERGPFVDANARAGFVGISSQHGYGDLVRAVFEGLAFAARDCYGAMGRLPEEIRLSGGAARSATLRRIIGAALEAPVRTSRRAEAGAAGAAMIAAISTGVYGSMDDCAAEWVVPLLNAPEQPDPGLADTYARAYPVYAAAHAALRPVWRDLAASRKS